MIAFPPRTRLVAALLAGMLPALGASANATPQGANRFAGSYFATHINGPAVVRLELLLQNDGRARLKTGSSRYSDRPTAYDGKSVVETGTWHVRNGRLVLHIEHSSSDTDNAQAQPVFEDRVFVLAGCELRLIGASAGFTFDKHNCR